MIPDGWLFVHSDQYDKVAKRRLHIADDGNAMPGDWHFLLHRIGYRTVQLADYVLINSPAHPCRFRIAKSRVGDWSESSKALETIREIFPSAHYEPDPSFLYGVLVLSETDLVKLILLLD